MTTPIALLERYLRQRRELGEVELVLARPFELHELGKGASFAGATLASDSPAKYQPDRIDPTEGPAVRQPESRGQVAAPSPPRRSGGDNVDRHPAYPPVEVDSPGPVAPGLPSNHPLTVLNAAASGCTACGLAASRTHVVFGEGDPQARLMVVGEAPGADEDRTGRPFVGKAGALLNRLLESIGFPRESVYICNVLKCRPPGNRNPLPAEVEACARFLQGQLEAVAPKAILAVGTFPAQALLRTTEPIGRLRGRVHSYDGTPLVPTYHPAALLRNPGWIRPVWEDLQRLRQVLDAA